MVSLKVRQRIAAVLHLSGSPEGLVARRVVGTAGAP
jgi:hypothetical protein